MNNLRRVLFVCGAVDDAVRMEEIARQMNDWECRFTEYRGQELNGWFTQNGLAQKLAKKKKMREQCLKYLKEHHLAIDNSDAESDYDVVVSTPDLALRKTNGRYRLVLIQNAMMDHAMVEEDKVNAAERIVNRLPSLTRWLTGAPPPSTDFYDKLCVASDGYRDLFMRYGVERFRIAVTGIPTLDNFASFANNDFPYRDYALVVSSEEREVFEYESRKHFVQDALRIAQGWQLIFRIPADDKHRRTVEEVRELAPDARVFTNGEVGPMVANCGILITQCPSVAFIGMVLGKEVHSYMNLARAYGLLPLQNGGQSARNIAQVCRDLPPAISSLDTVPEIDNPLYSPAYSI